MSSEPAVSLHDVGKTYYIYQSPQDALLRQIYEHVASRGGLPRGLRAWLQRRAGRHGRRFDALQDVTFEVGKGESLGIIGRNGSGKSTLLQIVAGILTATRGRVEVAGRVAALLELGSGFNPEFTGRENLVLNGMILGAGPEEMKRRLPEIVEFAEIGDFLDQPVKTYSSGMMIRLAFAVQISVVPDVLLVDEALSVGDIFFAQKCVRRIRELQARGTTILFVSHDMALVRDLCERAVYLRQGRVCYLGPKDRAISLYFQSGADGTPVRAEKGPVPATSASSRHAAFKREACWVAGDSVSVEAEARLALVAVLDAEGRPTLGVTLGQPLTFRVLYQSLGGRPVHVAVAVKNRYDQLIFSGGSYTHQLEPPALRPGEYGCFEMTMDCMIEAGQYTFIVVLSLASEVHRGIRIDETPWLGPLSVRWDYDAGPAPFYGLFGVPTVARFRPPGEDPEAESA
jgi:lipopolysaccharide transport system ATP-binding protein